VIAMEQREREKGRPYGCDFQAGYFTCPNTYRPPSRCVRNGRWGWACSECGTFYPEKEPST
jgi:hypothetical protein